MFQCCVMLWFHIGAELFFEVAFKFFYPQVVSWIFWVSFLKFSIEKKFVKSHVDKHLCQMRLRTKFCPNVYGACFSWKVNFITNMPIYLVFLSFFLCSLLIAFSEWYWPITIGIDWLTQVQIWQARFEKMKDRNLPQYWWGVWPTQLSVKSCWMICVWFCPP